MWDRKFKAQNVLRIICGVLSELCGIERGLAAIYKMKKDKEIGFV